MKIDHIDGTTTDTNTLSTDEAIVLEKAEEFKKFCSDNKIPFVLTINPSGGLKKYISYWNFQDKTTNYNQMENKKNINLSPLLSAINNFIVLSTNNQYTVSKITP